MRTGLIDEIKRWRDARNLTMDEAGAMVVVDGKPTHRATWHAWEHGRKRPSRKHMPMFCQVTGLSADLFNQPANSDATAPLSEVA